MRRHLPAVQPAVQPAVLPALLAVLLAVLCLAVGAVPTAVASTGAGRAAHHAHARSVSAVTYHLGDGAWLDPTVTYYDDPDRVVEQELTAVVHYPTHLGRTEHPLVMMVHGSWWTCQNHVTRKPTGEWPCKRGTRPLQSYRGYDYLGKALARRGFVVVSISANGINAHALGDPDYYGRAHLLNEHLRMWQRLVSTGRGPLDGAFRDLRTHRRVEPDFVGHVDLRDVGTLGHSRGGRAVMWQASDKHRHEWPGGVRVRGVLALAPVYFVPPGETKRNTLVTRVPFEVVTASCDGAVGGDEPGRDYVRDAQGRNPDATTVSIRGGNHNQFNTEWTPHNIGGDDDATSPCAGRIGGTRQRDVTKRLVVAFFRRTLG